MAKKISQLDTRGTVVPATPLPQDADLIEVAISGVDSYQLSMQGMREYVAANFLPAADNVSDIGSASFRFNDGFFGGTVTAVSFAGTLTTAAQPNVTSVGTLTALAVSGAYNGTSTSAGALKVGNLTADTVARVQIGGLTSNSAGGANSSVLSLHSDTSGNAYHYVRLNTSHSLMFDLYDGAAVSNWLSVTANGSLATRTVTVSAGTTAVQALTAASTVTFTKVGAPLFIDNTDAAGLNALIVGKRGGTTRWHIGFDASENFTLINAAGAAAIFTVANSGAITAAGALSGVTQAILDQGAADGEILTLRSSDVAHGMTTTTDTTTYGRFSKVDSAGGGLTVWGLSELTYAVQLRGTVTTGTDIRSTSALGPVLIDAALKSGTAEGNVGGDSNLVVVRNNTTTRFILDSDGDSHQDVGTAWTNFDTMDDVKALNILAAHVTRRDDPLRESFGVFLQEERDFLERAKIVSFNDDGHHFVNMSKLTMLHTGAIRQLGGRVDKIEAENAQLRNELALLKSGRAATQLLTA